MWLNQIRNNRLVINPTQSKLKVRNDQGSTLIELVIAILVAGVVLVGVSIGIMYSIQRTALARYREIGTTLAQESIEVFYKERARLGWQNFEVLYGGGGSFCLNQETKVIELAPCDIITQLDHDFVRQIEVVKNGDKIDVGVTVTWAAGRIEDQPSVSFNQSFAQTY